MNIRDNNVTTASQLLLSGFRLFWGRLAKFFQLTFYFLHVFLRLIITCNRNTSSTSGIRYSGFSIYSSEGQSVTRSARDRRCFGWFWAARRRCRKISISGLLNVHSGIGGENTSGLVEPLLDSWHQSNWTTRNLVVKLRHWYLSMSSYTEALMRCKSLSYPTVWNTIKHLRIKLSRGAQNAYCYPF